MNEITRNEAELVELLRRVRFCLQLNIDQADVIENCLEKFHDLISKIELATRDLPKEQRSMMRKSLRQRKFQMKNLVNQYHESRKDSELDEVGGGRTVSKLLDEEKKDQLSELELTEEAAFLYAWKIQHEDDKILNEVIQTVIDTTNVATATAINVHQQTLQINRINEDIDGMDKEIDRAAKKIKQIAAGVLKQKVIWCLLFLIIACIIFIILLKTGRVKIDRPE